MDLSHPIESVIPSAHGPVLAVLASTEAPLTGRGVGALLDGRVSARRVGDVLNELVQAGLVRRDPAGAAYQYRLNRDHLAAPAITALAGLRSTLLDAIATEVDQWSRPAIAVWLFGSVARGDAAPDSDVDLLVIRPSAIADDDQIWVDQVTNLEQRVQAWSGNHATVVDYDVDEFASVVDSNDSLIDALRSDAIRIAGDSVLQRCRTRDDQ